MPHRTLITAIAAATLLPALASPALGSPAAGSGGEKGNGSYRAHLAPVKHDPTADSGSHVTADAHLVATNGELKVRLEASGLSPNLPHLIHIHGAEQAENECPDAGAAVGGKDSGLIETLEGVPDYGPIRVTFSTSGGTTAELADSLALGRAPVADSSGDLTYRRKNITVGQDLQHELEKLHIVIHGEDLNENGRYDGEQSTLGEAVGAYVPVEAELPVACGEIHR